MKALILILSFIVILFADDFESHMVSNNVDNVRIISITYNGQEYLIIKSNNVVIIHVEAHDYNIYFESHMVSTDVDNMRIISITYKGQEYLIVKTGENITAINQNAGQGQKESVKIESIIEKKDWMR